MKFICVDITTLNSNKSLDAVSSIGLLIGDTDTEDTEFTELSIIQPFYTVDPFMLKTAISEFSDILDEDTEKYYIENLSPRIYQYLGDNGVSYSEEFMVVTSNIKNSLNMLDKLFGKYNVDYVNLRVDRSGRKSDICNRQAELFREFFRLFL
jgi:hypothetical protein